jgi:signal transduction histidine kinase
MRLQSLLEGQQQERIRISQEIHDDMGSGLTSMLFISRSLDTSGADVSAVKKLSSLATSLIEKMNEIVWAMRGEPELLEDFVLHLRSLAGELLGDAGMELDFRIEDSIPHVMLPTDYRHPVYLVMKEAIHNCIKHSGASRVVISLRFASLWSIDVQDNGVGMADIAPVSGNGLRNMRKRVTAIHGQLSITRENGTRVHLELPPVV